MVETKAAKHFGKQLNNFWKHTETKEYVHETSKTFRANELVMTKAGNGGGTWSHPRL